MYNLKNKFIFTHPGKCAGTSIKHMFYKTDISVKTHPSFIEISNHPSLTEIINHMKDHGYDYEEFFKFSIIRNPWDRAVSWYYHYIENFKHIEFNEYINGGSCELTTEKYMFHKGRFELDYVIKVEDIKNGVAHVMNKLGFHDYNLANFDHYTTRPREKPYQSYYNDETKNIVAEQFKWDIETFGYTFD